MDLLRDHDRSGHDVPVHARHWCRWSVRRGRACVHATACRRPAPPAAGPRHRGVPVLPTRVRTKAPWYTLAAANVARVSGMAGTRSSISPRGAHARRAKSAHMQPMWQPQLPGDRGVATVPAGPYGQPLPAYGSSPAGSSWPAAPPSFLGAPPPQQQLQQQQPQGLPSYTPDMRQPPSSASSSSRPLPAPLPRYGGAPAGAAGAAGAPSLQPMSGFPPAAGQQQQRQVSPQPSYEPPAQARPQPSQTWTPSLPSTQAPMSLGGAGAYSAPPSGYGVPGSAPSYQQQPPQSYQPPPPPSQPARSSVGALMPPPAGAAIQPASIPSADGRPAYERSWSDLASREQEACRVLGYDRRKWDDEREELADGRVARQMVARQMATQMEMAAEAAVKINGAVVDVHDEERRQTEQRVPGAPAAPSGFDLSASERTNSLWPSGPYHLAVEVVDTELDEHTSTVFYVMNVFRPHETQWKDGPQRVRKRYSEFESLRRELSATGGRHGVKSLDFPAKKRIKGKRGGRKDEIVDTRSSELQTWLNDAIRLWSGLGQSEQIVEEWFLASSAVAEVAADAAGSESARSSVASRASQSV